MSTEEIERDKQTEAAVAWLPEEVRPLLDNFADPEERKRVLALVTDTYLYKGSEEIDGVYVVPDNPEDFRSRLRTLLAEDEGYRRLEDRLFHDAIRSDKVFIDIADLLKAKMAETSDSGELKFVDRPVTKINENDFPKIREAVNEWMNYMWNLRERGGILGKFMKSMSFMDDKVGDVVPPTTFDKLTNALARDGVSRFLTGMVIRRGLTSMAGAENMIKSSVDLSDLLEKNITNLRTRVLEMVTNAMTEWQMNNYKEDGEIEATDKLKYLRMSRATSLFSHLQLLRQYGDQQEVEVIAKLFTNVAKQENV